MLTNMLGFNLAWFGLIYWGNAFIPVAISMIAFHLIKLSHIKNEARLVLLITVIGSSIDSLLHFFMFFMFPDSTFMPFWLVILWACFACTVCHSLTFLSSSKVLQITIGAIFAPLSYIAGERLEAVSFGYPLLTTYLILAAIWGGLFILFFFLKSVMTNTRLAHA